MAQDPLNAQAVAINADLEARCGALNFGWNDDSKVRSLAKLALANTGETLKLDCSFTSPEGQAKMEIISLVPTILNLIEQAKAAGTELSPGPAWTAFAKALITERAARG